MTNIHPCSSKRPGSNNNKLSSTKINQNQTKTLKVRFARGRAHIFLWIFKTSTGTKKDLRACNIQEL